MLKLKNPPKHLISLAKTVFKTMAFVQTIRPIVEGYQREILEAEKYPYADKHITRGRVNCSNYVSDPKQDYQMSDANFKLYMAQCRTKQAKAGLKTDHPDFCPLLVAEELQRKAENCFVNALEEFTDLSHNTLICAGLEIYREYLDLNLKLMSTMIK